KRNDWTAAVPMQLGYTVPKLGYTAVYGELSFGKYANALTLGKAFKRLFYCVNPTLCADSNAADCVYDFSDERPLQYIFVYKEANATVACSDNCQGVEPTGVVSCQDDWTCALG